jgi:hypothetical protein
VSQSYNTAIAESANSNNSWVERGIYFTLAAASAPLAFAEQATTAVLNIPYDASVGGQSLAQASLATNTDDKVVAYLNAVSSFSAGFSTAAGIASPFAVEAPILTDSGATGHDDGRATCSS